MFFEKKNKINKPFCQTYQDKREMAPKIKVKKEVLQATPHK